MTEFCVILLIFAIFDGILTDFCESYVIVWIFAIVDGIFHNFMYVQIFKNLAIVSQVISDAFNSSTENGGVFLCIIAWQFGQTGIKSFLGSI